VRPPGLVVDLGVAVIAEGKPALRLVAGADVVRDGGAGAAALAVAEGAGEYELAESGLGAVVAIRRPRGVRVAGVIGARCEVRAPWLGADVRAALAGSEGH
jgi:hypothetical protein